jgi:hypothetical protein
MSLRVAESHGGPGRRSRAAWSLAASSGVLASKSNMPSAGERIELSLAWGDGADRCVLAASFLAPGEQFSVGESRDDCDVVVPAEALGSPRWVLADWSGGPVIHVPEGGCVAIDGSPKLTGRVALSGAMVVDVAFGSFSVRAQLVSHDQLPATARRSWDFRLWAPLAVSAVAHALCIVVFSVPQPTGGQDAGESSVAIRSRLLAHASANEEQMMETLVSRGMTRRELPAHQAAQSDDGEVHRETAHVVHVPGSPSTTGSASAPLSRLLETGDMYDMIQRQIASWDPVLIKGEHHTRPPVTNPDQLPSRRIPQSTIAGVVRANIGRFRMCMSLERAGTPAVGRVDIAFVIGPNGTVDTAHDAGGEVGEAVRRCIVRQFSMLTFPATPTGKDEAATYELVLSPADPERRGERQL